MQRMLFGLAMIAAVSVFTMSADRARAETAKPGTAKPPGSQYTVKACELDRSGSIECLKAQGKPTQGNPANSPPDAGKQHKQ
jgi:hypothetical protein